MQKQSSLLTLHEALSAAMMRDLQDLPYQKLDHEAIAKLNLSPQEKAERRSAGTLPMCTAYARPTDREVDVCLFSQTWGSTALGYGGMGGAAMTPAYTVIVSTYLDACVYFGGSRLAYQVTFANLTEEQKQAWELALLQRWMPSRDEAVAQLGAVIPSP